MYMCARPDRCGSMDEQLENRLRFLRKASTEQMPHSEVGLLDHLLGTRQLLIEWEARPALCDAGLFHSVYGTEHYELKARAADDAEGSAGVDWRGGGVIGVVVLHDAS